MLTALLSSLVLGTAAYDPLRIDASFVPKTVDLTLTDAKRERALPVRAYLPAGSERAPIVIFSHGLGGSSKNNAFMGKHWAARGFVCIFVQHPGSDESVWRGAPLRDRMQKMNAAANGRNMTLRFEDIRFVIDELSKRENKAVGAVGQRLDASKIGMCGHSFGAVTTQGVSGQWFPAMNQKYTDARIDAAAMFSPSAPQVGDPNRAFQSVKIPWLLMTGTEDVAPIGGATLEDRLAVFPALPKGNKYEVVFFGAEHMAFGDTTLPGRETKRNPNHHRSQLAITTAFWEAHLLQQDGARAWLDGDGPRSILEPKDTWKKK